VLLSEVEEEFSVLFLFSGNYFPVIHSMLYIIFQVILSRQFKRIILFRNIN